MGRPKANQDKIDTTEIIGTETAEELTPEEVFALPIEEVAPEEVEEVAPEEVEEVTPEEVEEVTPEEAKLEITEEELELLKEAIYNAPFDPANNIGVWNNSTDNYLCPEFQVSPGFAIIVEKNLGLRAITNNTHMLRALDDSVLEHLVGKQTVLREFNIEF